MITKLKRPAVLKLASKTIPVEFVRHRRARHYVLRVTEEGAARVTLPPYGNKKEALAFAQAHAAWFEKQMGQSPSRRADAPRWQHGTTILFRGEHVALNVDADLFGTTIRLADQLIQAPCCTLDCRAAVTEHLWQLARQELPVRTHEVARQLGLREPRVTVRSQRTLWGSCSPSGRISLNWRLLQAPASVRDYVVVHELMHLKELNHSNRFWNLVRSACPHYREAEQWLKQNGTLLVL